MPHQPYKYVEQKHSTEAEHWTEHDLPADKEQRHPEHLLQRANTSADRTMHAERIKY